MGARDVPPEVDALVVGVAGEWRATVAEADARALDEVLVDRIKRLSVMSPRSPSLAALRRLREAMVLAGTRNRVMSADGPVIGPSLVGGAAVVQGASRVELTTRDAAARLGVSDRQVRRLCERGALAFRRIGERDLLVDAASVEAYRSRRAS